MSVATARRAAETLLGRTTGTVPINVLAIASSLNIRVTKTLLGDDVSGLLITKDGVVTICVEAKHHLHRQRFTVAHELGHHVLRHQFEPGAHVHVDRGMLVSKRSAQGSRRDPKEIEANQFAAALLMPEIPLARAMESAPHVDDVAVIRHVAHVFRVSEQALTIRLASLGWL